MKPFPLILAVLLTASAFCARAGDDTPRRLTLITAAGVASHTITEADTGGDLIGLVAGGLFTLSTNAVVTGQVEVVSGSITNQPDTFVTSRAYHSYSPDTYWYVNVGDTLRIRLAPTNIVLTGWVWLQ